MDKENVSIIVPVYNVSEYLEECLRTICAQTYEALEIIIVDDGSTDSSGDICDSFSRMDKRITVLHKENGGIVSARKAGLEIASGKYVLNVDGDDWLEEDMVEVLVHRMDGEDYVFIESGFYYEDTIRREVLFGKGEFSITDSNKNSMVADWLDGKCGLREVLWNKLFKMDFFKKIYSKVPDTMSNGEDLLFYIFSLDVLGKRLVIDIPLYHYRVREKSVSHGESMKVLSTRMMAEAYIISKVCELYNVSENKMMKWLMRRPLSIVNNEYKLKKIHIPKYELNFVDKIRGCDVAIYGAGAVGQDYVYQLYHFEDIRIIAWIDQNPMKYGDLSRKVEDKSRLVNLEYDYVIVAISDEMIASQIMEELKRDYCIDASKLIWEKPGKIELFG